jgi:ABC-type multidrug transport system fused ATPase/permease subunit
MGDLFDGLEVEAYDRQYTDRELVRRIVRYFTPHKRALLIITGTVLTTALFETLIPIIVSQGITRIARNSPSVLVVGLAGLYLVVATSAWLMNLFRRRATGRTIGDIVRNMRYDAFSSAISRDMSFYDEFASAKIVSRITSDTQEFAQVIVLIADLISKLFMMIFLGVILLTTEWHMALILFVLSPSVILIALAFRAIARRTSRQGNRMIANVNNMISESVKGIQVAKNFRQEQRIYNDFDVVNRQAYRINLRRGFVFSAIFPILNLAAGLIMALLLYIGAQNALSGAITVGAWYLFIQSVWYFWDPLTGVASFWSQFQAGLASSERVFALIDAPQVVVQTGAKPVPKLAGDIEFRDLAFRYDDKGAVLPQFNLHIRPGETVAFVGHTGAGKSSIAKLVARFYEFQGGGLYIDGEDIRTLDLAAYRRHLGIVSQVPFLFAGTIAENIRYGRPEATDAEILEAARLIGDGEWLDTLPDGLQTQVGERGARLSLGQRQLVALIRVLVQNPTIFILDEATASIDPFTEAQIQQALSLILAKSTSILIAHRLSTVRSADRIIVLKQGQVIEEGNHEALIANGGHYAELYNTYFRHQSLEYLEAARNL